MNSVNMEKIVAIRFPNSTVSRLRVLRGLSHRSASNIVRTCVEMYLPIMEREYGKLAKRLGK
jgi:predicted DNA-binding protein